MPVLPQQIPQLAAGADEVSEPDASLCSAMPMRSCSVAAYCCCSFARYVAATRHTLCLAGRVAISICMWFARQAADRAYGLFGKLRFAYALAAEILCTAMPWQQGAGPGC